MGGDHIASVLVACVLALQAVLVARIESTRRHVRAGTAAAQRANEQVSNDHDSNLRDDLDGKHDELRSLIGAVDRRLDGQASDIRGIRRDVGRLTDDQREHEHRLDDLEHTIPPRTRSPWAAPTEGASDEPHRPEHAPGPVAPHEDGGLPGGPRRRGRRAARER